MIPRSYLFWALLWAIAFYFTVANAEDLPEAAPSEATAPTSGYTPMEAGVEGLSGEFSSGRNVFLHPYLSLAEYYTDNLFNVDDNEESDFVTVITPGIWVALPAARQPVVQINTLNTAPGGMAVSRFATNPRRRFQSYALYRAEIQEHKDFSDEDRIDQRAEGLMLFRLRGGLSLEVLDVYEINEDPYATGTSTELDKFTSNLFSTSANYRYSPKLRFRLDYSLYSLDYKADRNAFRERDDNTLYAFAFFRAFPKTSVFFEYNFNDIDYEQDGLFDSEEHRFFTGLQMDASRKTRARVKVGVGLKRFEESGPDNRTDFLAEGQIDHRFTPKTSAYLRLIRRTNETDIDGTEAILVTRFQVGYRQKLTAKINASASLSYTLDSYQGDITVDSLRGERKDDYYNLQLGLGYSITKWLNISGGYYFTRRDSNFNSFDYQTNRLFLTLTAAL